MMRVHHLCKRLLPRIYSNHCFPRYIETDSFQRFEDETLKYQDLLTRYQLHDISSHQSILFIHPYLEDGDDRFSLQEESIQLIKTLGWSLPNFLPLPVPSLSRKTIFSLSQIEQMRDLMEKDDSALYSGIFINLDSIFHGHRLLLESSLGGLPVFDRYTAVLQIFKNHARTREAKLQVSLAEIPYLKQRLRGDYAVEKESKYSKSRQGEPFFQHHMRALGKREARIKEDLDRLKNQRAFLRKARRKYGAPVVAVVGYTNSGKTSLIKALTGTEKLEPENKLFATLDVTAHGGVLLHSRLKVIFVDTVGFISNIPNSLMKSFASTLEDVSEADILLHVRDLSHPDHEKQNRNVLHTLRSIVGVNKDQAFENMIVVYNKVDKMQPEDIKQILSKDEEKALPISTTHFYGLRTLSEIIENRVLKISERHIYTLRVKNGGQEYLWIRRNFSIAEEKPDENDLNFIFVKTALRKMDFNKFRAKFIHENPIK